MGSLPRNLELTGRAHRNNEDLELIKS